MSLPEMGPCYHHLLLSFRTGHPLKVLCLIRWVFTGFDKSLIASVVDKLSLKSENVNSGSSLILQQHNSGRQDTSSELHCLWMMFKNCIWHFYYFLNQSDTTIHFFSCHTALSCLIISFQQLFNLFHCYPGDRDWGEQYLFIHVSFKNSVWWQH